MDDLELKINSQNSYLVGQNDKFKTYDSMMDNRDARLERIKNTMNQTRDDTDETLTELRQLIMERTSLHAI